jgi:hypothetical protein
LHEVVATAHLAAETVSPRGDGHGVRAIGRGLNQDGHLQPGEADGVDYAALFAKVGKGNDDAVDFVGVLLEQFCALLRLSVSLHRAVFGVLRAQHDGAGAGSLKDLDDLIAAGFCQVIRKKSAIAYNDAKCHCLLRCHFLCSLSLSRLRGITLSMNDAE